MHVQTITLGMKKQGAIPSSAQAIYIQIPYFRKMSPNNKKNILKRVCLESSMLFCFEKILLSVLRASKMRGSFRDAG